MTPFIAVLLLLMLIGLLRAGNADREARTRVAHLSGRHQNCGADKDHQDYPNQNSQNSTRRVTAVCHRTFSMWFSTRFQRHGTEMVPAVAMPKHEKSIRGNRKLFRQSRRFAIDERRAMGAEVCAQASCLLNKRETICSARKSSEPVHSVHVLTWRRVGKRHVSKKPPSTVTTLPVM